MQIPKHPIKDSSYWTPQDLAKSTDWHYTLTESDQQEILAAVDRVADKQINAATLTKNDFCLPQLGSVLQHAKQQLLQGWGIFQLHGLPVEQLNEMQHLVMSLGLSCHFGNLRPQHRYAWLVAHVRDFGIQVDPKNKIISRTPQHINMHCDSADITALLCLGVSAQGGQSAVANALHIHNYLLQNDPEIHQTLFELIPYDRRNERLPGQDPWYMMSVFSWYQQKLIANFNYQYIQSCQQNIFNSPRLTDLQWAAVKMFDTMSQHPDFCYHYNFKIGDLQLISNHNLVHGRTAYEDSAQHTRHLLRVWISPEEGIPLPKHYESRWGSVQPGQRGGTIINDIKPCVKTFTQAQNQVSLTNHPGQGL